MTARLMSVSSTWSARATSARTASAPRPSCSDPARPVLGCHDRAAHVGVVHLVRSGDVGPHGLGAPAELLDQGDRAAEAASCSGHRRDAPVQPSHASILMLMFVV